MIKNYEKSIDDLDVFPEGPHDTVKAPFNIIKN